MNLSLSNKIFPSNFQPDRQILWQNRYSNTKFFFQLCFMLFNLYLWLKLVYYTISYYNKDPIYVVAGFIIAQFFVDFISGFLHWGCDTWGRFDTPIIGSTLIRTFRMHHVDPQDITRHGFVQTNASSCYPMPFFISIGLYVDPGNAVAQIYQWTFVFAIVLGVMTNQFHKWAHMVHLKPHPIVTFLQRSRLILSHGQHHRHHQNQFDKAYCITNGWMNPILEKINFWKIMQLIIQKTTGAIPRADDSYWRPKYT